MSFSTLYGSSGFFNCVVCAVVASYSFRFSTLYGSSGFFNSRQSSCWRAAVNVSVPSTGQVDSSTLNIPAGNGDTLVVSVPSTGQVDSSTRSMTSCTCGSTRSFSTLYGSSGFFNRPSVALSPIKIVVSVPSTGQVDSSTRKRRAWKWK